ncbi:MAG: hypothetical protein M3384_17740 [Acidobacteriota bacterium]|nr:hypothetical protein [Acidobacteriota bacterium]
MSLSFFSPVSTSAQVKNDGRPVAGRVLDIADAEIPAVEVAFKSPVLERKAGCQAASPPAT